MVPTIAFEGELQPHLESGRFAQDLGVAFIVASHWYEQFLLEMKKDYLGNE